MNFVKSLRTPFYRTPPVAASADDEFLILVLFYRKEVRIKPFQGDLELSFERVLPQVIFSGIF